MKAGYTIETTNFFGNSYRAVAVNNYHSRNVVSFIHWSSKEDASPNEYTVAIFKIKPKSK